MKVKLLSALILFTSQFSFSQTIKGKVVFNNYAILKSKSLMLVQNTCSSDANGEFSIAKTNDILVFVSKEHQVKITINPKLFTMISS
jgi:hypothetical protein